MKNTETIERTKARCKNKLRHHPDTIKHSISVGLQLMDIKSSWDSQYKRDQEEIDRLFAQICLRA
jgi:hypothetical protein